MSGRRGSRLLALALLALMLAAVAVVVVVPAVAGYRERADAIEEYRDRVDRLQRVIAGADASRERLASMERRVRTSPYLLPEASSALATAALQERIKQAVDAAGGRLVSSQVLRPERRAGVDRVGLNVRMAADNEALLAVLHAIESTPPYVVVESLVIARPRIQRRRRTDAAPAARALLDINFTVGGLMLPREGATDG